MGGVVGGIIGYFVKTERWEEVPLERLRVSLTPRGDGQVALAFSVNFWLRLKMMNRSPLPLMMGLLVLQLSCGILPDYPPARLLM